jgi:DeoR/GlpR family transcriptional regulator of sugar metabolism
LQVVTNSLPVANLFAAQPATDLIVAGGYVHGRTGAIHGHYADAMVKTLNVRRAVLSAAGVTHRGLFNNNLLLAETERAMMAAANEVILVVESTKFGFQSLAHVCPLSHVERVVTDDQLSDDWKRQVIEAGAELILARSPDNTDTD